MHSTYKSSQPEEDLMQGDILERTPELLSILDKYHPHYTKNTKNKFFIILTQSCDLVRREKAQCNSRYITMAPIRSLDYILKKQAEKLSDKGFDVDFPVCTNKNKEKLIQFFERIINNNEANIFFLPQEQEYQIVENCCGLLQLPISIKAEHYEICKDSRILGLSNEFRAKLGWCSGHIYSRVGTEDFPKIEKNRIQKELINDRALWLDDKKLKQIKDEMANLKKTKPHTKIGRDELLEIAGKIPSLGDEVLKRVEDLVVNSKQIKRLENLDLLTDYHLDEIIRTIRSTPVLEKLGPKILDQIENTIRGSNSVKNLLGQKALSPEQLQRLIKEFKMDQFLKAKLSRFN